MIINSYRYAGGAAPGFDADYQAVLNYATAQGYTLPSAGQQTKQNQLMLDLKSAGVFSKMDAFWVLATDGDNNYALIDWVAQSKNATRVNSPTFTANQGYAGDGSTSYLDTPITDMSVLTKYLANNGHLAIYRYANPSSATMASASGATLGFTPEVRIDNQTSDFITRIQSTNANSPNVDSSGTGFIALSRNSSANYLLRRAGSSSTITSTSRGSVLVGAAFQILRYAFSFSDETLSFVAVGGAVNTEIAAYETAINTYITSL